MFDKLEDLLIRFEEIMGELHEPTVTNNQERFRKLMKEQSDLTPIVDAYTEYKKCKQDIEDSLSMLEEEKDEEMREMIKETLNDSKKRVEELEQELKILLLPKDPNDDKNIILESLKLLDPGTVTLERTAKSHNRTSGSRKIGERGELRYP